MTVEQLGGLKPAHLRLIEAVEQLAGARDEMEVAAIVRTAARALTGADGVAVVLKKGDRVHYVDEDAVAPLWKGQDFPVDACVSGWAIKHKQTVVITDITADARVPLAAYQPTFVKSLAMAPVGRPEPFAAVGAYWSEVRRPTDDEITALETMARATAVALENVRLRASLEEALAEARASESAKSMFLANMSHEIRTPLNGVVALVDLLGRSKLDVTQQEMTRLIQSSTQHLLRVVSDILDFSKIEAGKVDLEIAPFELESCVRDAAAVFAARALEKGLTFDLAFGPHVRGAYLGDADRVKQIVSNLVANAVKFTEQGGVAVRVEEEDTIGERAMMEIIVSDSGPGFDDAEAHTLFERFTQADATLTRRHDGAGLGLAIADVLARAMGGSIEVRSRRGYGSTFTLRLPLDRASSIDHDTVHVDDLAPGAPPRLRILCAEDHPDNQKVLRLSLSSLGADVVMVKDGAEAVAAVASSPPDVILMDMQMPVMDGLEATRRIRAQEHGTERAPTPIVMVTAHAMRQHVTAAFLAGVDVFLPKPVTPAQLAEAIQSALQARAA